MSSFKHSVILVDDEEGIRRVLALVLKDLGYAVSTAPGGAEALEELAALSPQSLPDVVITDIKMPGMGGLELLQTIKERYPDIEVVMLTGHGDMELAIASLQRGAGDFLNKPVADAALEVALRRAVERREMRLNLRQHQENLERLVELRTRELIAAERFAAVGEAAASLAHSIKNIAGALEGTMFVLEKGLELDKREYFEEGWRMIRGDVARVSNLAVGLLELGRPYLASPALSSPARPLTDIALLLASRAAEDGVQLEVSLPDHADECLLDAGAVHQCLLNLALNALEAVTGRPDAAVHLALENMKKNGGIFLRYSVRDNGPGLPEGIIAGSSAGFTSSKATGNGIGIFSTRKLARAIGAELSFKSTSSGTLAYLDIVRECPQPLPGA